MQSQEPPRTPKTQPSSQARGSGCIYHKHPSCRLDPASLAPPHHLTANRVETTLNPRSKAIALPAKCIRNEADGHGGVTTTSPDATHPPPIFQNSGGGGQLVGVQPGVGGGVFLPGVGGGVFLPGVGGGVRPGVMGVSSQG